MSFFKDVEGEAAVLVENGVYRQVPLATRDGYLYARFGGGYVRLMADGSTTKAKARLEFMSWNGPLCRDPLGRLCTPMARGAQSLEKAHEARLLGSAIMTREEWIIIVTATALLLAVTVWVLFILGAYR